MDTTEIIILAIQGIVLILAIVAYVEIVRARLERLRQERQAGDFLATQVAEAPEGATIILGAAKYRTRTPLRIVRDNVTLQGAPESTSQILVEGDNNAIEVENAKDITIRDMHIEILGPPPEIPVVTEQDYLDEGLTPMDDEPQCGLKVSPV